MKKKRETCVCVQQGESNCKIETRFCFIVFSKLLVKIIFFQSKL